MNAGDPLGLRSGGLTAGDYLRLAGNTFAGAADDLAESVKTAWDFVADPIRDAADSLVRAGDELTATGELLDNELRRGSSSDEEALRRASSGVWDASGVGAVGDVGRQVGRTAKAAGRGALDSLDAADRVLIGTCFFELALRNGKWVAVEKGIVEVLDDRAARAARHVPRGVPNPYGPAVQDLSEAALAAHTQVQQGTDPPPGGHDR